MFFSWRKIKKIIRKKEQTFYSIKSGSKTLIRNKQLNQDSCSRRKRKRESIKPIISVLFLELKYYTKYLQKKQIR